jgi:hypothetical protein
LTALQLQRLTGLAIAGGCALLAACGPEAKPAAVKPAKTELVAHETELLRLTLTPDAERRLGLQTVAVGSGASRRTRAGHGELVAAPLAGGLPVAAGADLGALAASQARADGDIARTRAELEVAEKAHARAEGLVREEAGSVRARDEAASALGVARANLATARTQRALLGQGVAIMGRQGPHWVRVAAFASDLGDLDRAAPASVRALGGDGVELRATPVNGPPSSNAAAGTVDLYYAIPNPGPGLRIGQRVAVDLPVRGQSSGLMAPAAAILRDIYGGEWVYVRVAPRTYERRRIEVAAVEGGQVLVARGLQSGAQVVTAGAAELFGTEFGAK